jgi:hypothetical protein
MMLGKKKKNWVYPFLIFNLLYKIFYFKAEKDKEVEKLMEKIFESLFLL